MIRRTMIALLFAIGFFAFADTNEAQAQQAFGRQYAYNYNTQDWGRFKHYPYTYYPHNYWGSDYYRSSESLYYRYPAQMRIPTYNPLWHNYYPQARKFHRGHHFILDTF